LIRADSNQEAGMGMSMRRLWGAVAAGLILSAASSAQAGITDLADPLDFLSGDLLDPTPVPPWEPSPSDLFDPSNILMAGDIEDLIDCNLLGDCAGAPKVKDFNIGRIGTTERWIGDAARTSGMMVVDLDKRFGFDTDTDDAAEVWTTWGRVFRWRAKSRAEYYVAKYELRAPVDNSSGYRIAMTVRGVAVPNTGSQVPKTYSAPWQSILDNRYKIRTLRFAGRHTWNSPYGIWKDGMLFSFASKKFIGKAKLVNPAGTVLWRKYKMGKFTSKSFKANGKYHNHLVYRAFN
jgi:hypothetical protein